MPAPFPSYGGKRGRRIESAYNPELSRANSLRVGQRLCGCNCGAAAMTSGASGSRKAVNEEPRLGVADVA